MRNYHGYLSIYGSHRWSSVWTKRRWRKPTTYKTWDNVLTGVKHVDMMHMYLNGHKYIPDDKYTIADVLESEGFSLGYMYDLVCNKVPVIQTANS